MYSIIVWKDHSVTPGNTYKVTNNSDGTMTLTPTGTILQQGTNMSATNFNNMETGILAANLTAVEAFNLARLVKERTASLEGFILEATLTNTQKYPFNNSKTTVAFGPTNVRDTKNYTVVVEAEEIIGGCLGDIIISDKMLNGFKVEYTGSATEVKFKIYVQGGIW